MYMHRKLFKFVPNHIEETDAALNILPHLNASSWFAIAWFLKSVREQYKSYKAMAVHLF